MAKNKGLGAAKAGKKDEFYTQLTDIEKELQHYRSFFKDKVVLCNCDDPRISNFFRYFALNFKWLGIKKLITTCYKNQNVDLFSENMAEQAVYLEYDGTTINNSLPNLDEIGIKPLKGDGDFRSDECIELLKQADVVVTNPPFSLQREFIAQLIKYKKKFLILGNINNLATKDLAPFVIQNQLWLGVSIHSGDRKFLVPDDYPLNAAGCGIDENGNRFIRVKSVRWFTNIDYPTRHEDLILYQQYSPDAYPTFGNFKDCIVVEDTTDIPNDWFGLMAVPITFLDKYSPNQFEIIAITNDTEWLRANGAERIGDEILAKARKQGNKSHITANMVSLYYFKQDGTIKFTYPKLIIKRKL